MKIQRYDPRLRWPRAMAHAENSNFSPMTGRVICRVLRRYDLRENPYPTVAERGAEIERLMQLPVRELHRLGLGNAQVPGGYREAIVHHMLHDILHDQSYSGANR